MQIMFGDVKNFMDFFCGLLPCLRSHQFLNLEFQLSNLLGISRVIFLAILFPFFALLSLSICVRIRCRKSEYFKVNWNTLVLLTRCLTNCSSIFFLFLHVTWMRERSRNQRGGNPSFAQMPNCARRAFCRVSNFQLHFLTSTNSILALWLTAEIEISMHLILCVWLCFFCSFNNHNNLSY